MSFLSGRAVTIGLEHRDLSCEISRPGVQLLNVTLHLIDPCHIRASTVYPNTQLSLQLVKSNKKACSQWRNENLGLQPKNSKQDESVSYTIEKEIASHDATHDFGAGFTSTPRGRLRRGGMSDGIM